MPSFHFGMTGRYPKLLGGAHRADACQIEASGVERPQVSTFIGKAINRPLAGRTVDAHVGHLAQPFRP
jgi:hypothetical protein